jgi:hypothetical protein
MHVLERANAAVVPQLSPARSGVVPSPLRYAPSAPLQSPPVSPPMISKVRYHPLAHTFQPHPSPATDCYTQLQPRAKPSTDGVPLRLPGFVVARLAVTYRFGAVCRCSPATLSSPSNQSCSMRSHPRSTVPPSPSAPPHDPLLNETHGTAWSMPSAFDFLRPPADPLAVAGPLVLAVLVAPPSRSAPSSAAVRARRAQPKTARAGLCLCCRACACAAGPVPVLPACAAGPVPVLRACACAAGPVPVLLGLTRSPTAAPHPKPTHCSASVFGGVGRVRRWRLQLQ